MCFDYRHIAIGPAAVVISDSCTFCMSLYSLSGQHKDRAGLYNTLKYSGVKYTEMHNNNTLYYHFIHASKRGQTDKVVLYVFDT